MSTNCESYGIRKPSATMPSKARMLLSVACLSSLPAFAGDLAPAGGVEVLDQSVSLQRASTRDVGSRIIDVRHPCVLLLVVDELGFDVGLRTSSSTRDVGLSVDLENGQQGESLEIAVLSFAARTRLTIEISGPQERVAPGAPRLRVVSYPPFDLQAEAQRLRLGALEGWMRATRADLTPELARRDAVPRLDDAIARLSSGPAADAHLAARTRLLRARILYNLELGWKEAWLEAQRATAAFLSPAVHDPLNAARSRWLEAAALQEISLDRTAREPTSTQAERESRAILREISAESSAMDAVGRARSFNLLALADRYSLDWLKARERFEAAILQYRAAGHRAGEMQSLQNLALLESDRGDYAAAMGAYGPILARIESISDPEMRASFLINAAAAESNAGQTDAAIAHYLMALEITREHHFDPPQGRVLQGLGTAYWARGDFLQAETYFNEALALRTRLQDALGMFGSLISAGKLLRASGNPEAALQRHEAALARAPNKLHELQALVQIAEDHAAMGAYDAAIATSRKALAIEIANSDHPARADAQLTLARLLMARNAVSDSERTEALTLSQVSIRAARNSADIGTEIEARRVFSRALLASGKRAAASEELRRSIDLILAYRRSSASPELRASTLAGQQQVFRDLVDLELPQDGAAGAWTAHELTKRQRDALRILESVRALDFDDQPARATTGPLEPLDQALGELAARQIRVSSLRARESPPQADIELLQLEMANLRARIDQLRSSASANARGVAASTWSVPAERETQLSYIAGSGRMYVLQRTAQEMRLWTLPETPSALDAAVHALARIDRTQHPGAYDQALIALSPKLLPPGGWGEGIRSLRIAADGALALVPFAGLSERESGSRRLVDAGVVRMSASLLTEAAATKRGIHKYRFAAIGGPTQGSQGSFATLPGAAREVSAISQLFARSGAARPARLFDADNASTHAIRSTLESGVDVMHFATHGFADSRHPLAAMLALPGAQASARYLTAGEVQEWRGSADLVFLSACDTAVGTPRFGESLPGLQRAFLRAGASDVIATLWPVEDRLAEEFAVQFYRRLAGGEDARIALAATQRAWATSSGGVSQQKAQRMKVAAWAYALYSR